MKIFRRSARQLATFALFGTLIVAANQAVFSQLVCQPSGSPIVQAGTLTAGDPTQTGRINRNGITGSCPTGKTNMIFNTTPVAVDTYNYSAPVTGCATVQFNATACGGATTQMVAYSSFNPASPGDNVISDFGFSTTGVADFSFPVTMGQNFTLTVHDILESPTNLFCTSYTYTLTYRTNCRLPGYDRSGDAKADPTFFRPSTGVWSVLNSAGGTNSLLFGLNNDVPVAGDYTGDGQTDVSVYRPSSNTWFYSTSQSSPQTNVTFVPWGSTNDVATPGDYDGDGKADVAVWRPSDGNWYVLRSSDSSAQVFHWGQNGDIPVAADFDGDLKTDFAIVRPNEAGITPNYRWYYAQSNFNFGFGLVTTWGIAGDRIVPGDYNGDGKADIAVFRPSDGNWYVLNSFAQNAAPLESTTLHWGAIGDIPQPADYDGDGRTDYAVFRPSTGIWYNLRSNNGMYDSYDSPSWGTATDVPATAPYPIRP